MDKISPIKEKILIFLENQQINKTDFCRITGISYANLKGESLKSEIGGAQIVKILETYPINPSWLLMGDGEMLKDGANIHNESGVVVNGNNSNSPIDNRHYTSDSPDVLKMQIEELERTQDAKEALIKEQDARIKEQDARIKEQDARIKEQDARIKEQDARIDLLLSQITQLHSQVDALIQMNAKH